jgi:hypothetical protein
VSAACADAARARGAALRHTQASISASVREAVETDVPSFGNAMIPEDNRDERLH